MSRDREDAADRLIVALDNPDLGTAEGLMDRLLGKVRLFKVGSALFTRHGPAAIEAVHRRGGRVFLDLKFHDIPQVVGLAARQAAQMGVFMFDVHAAGGPAFLRAARQAVTGPDPAPLLIAVTVLTSLDAEDLKSIGFIPTAEDLAIRLAKMTQDAGVDGVVASPHEVRAIREACGEEFVIVTPGVRPAGSEKEKPTDQKRYAAPADALAAGSDYLVVGRPIASAPDPSAAAEAVLGEMALAGRRTGQGRKS
ncbi:MAG: orotidine-5'-phosphate decarboxylase [Nitrospinota bacterium]